MQGRVLVIAGSDSGGGAGIQADIKTITMLGGFATTAITALTAQNTLGVQGIVPVPPAFVARQINSVLDDIGADAVKLGMLHSRGVIEAVAGELTQWPLQPMVLDPVMVSTSGHRLLEKDAIGALRALLFPLASIITPNLPEAELLLEGAIAPHKAPEAAQRLQEEWGCAVLLKGGHGSGEMLVDWLCEADGTLTPYPSQRQKSTSTHGTGCTLASALAAQARAGRAAAPVG